ncbi:response regulator [Vagococcus sp. PNs007]|uniref:Response regulator n=1 Tax=Vagococcus proximus TaxID=2991417 RepID=A0ABT5WZY2_9ENTE|nr:response regulator [Vagococcus proximus]MDF0479217.1 response regulator [Vagococcus proximus]
MHLLIVDDEKRIRLGLKKIIEKSQPEITAISLASNGEEALEILQKQSDIKLLITDIRMSPIDGLELLTELNAQDRKIRSIILSAYNEFSYAKKALTLGVENYLLKPIDKEELENSLGVMIEKELENTPNSQEINFKEAMGYRWISNKIGDNEFAEKNQWLDIPEGLNYYQVILLEGISRNKLLTLRGRINNKVAYILVGAVTAEISYLVVGYKEKNESEEVFFEIQKFCKVQSIYGSWGGIVSDQQYLFKSFEESLSLFEWKMVRPKATLLFKEEQVLESVSVTDETVEKLCRAFNKGVAEWTEIFSENLKEYQKAYRLTPQQLKDYFELLYLRCGKQLIKREGHGELSILKQEMQKNTLTFKSWKQVEQVIRELAEQLQNELEREIQLDPRLREMKREVEENYKQPKQLADFAKDYLVSTAYIGKLFRAAFSVGYSSYINQVRLKKAYQLIRETNIPIVDISVQVGFTDISYFYRKFKEQYGVAPGKIKD